ncbi:hypothetical protein B7P25_23870 [Bacillus thuringiensis]|nr:hypothetical protein B7P25_23870 [Bacillus thuringiensis]TNO96657.1 hypothetical protein FH038_13270 [Bacillus sp. CD3-1a]
MKIIVEKKEISKLSNFYYKAIVRMYEILSVIMEDKVRLSLVWGCFRALMISPHSLGFYCTLK